MVATTEKPTLAALYEETVRPKLLEEFGLSNVLEAPSLSKIIVNCGIGRFLDTQKLKQEIADTVTSTLTTITGQRPVMVLARKSVSNFNVREGSPSAYMVTLRRDRMWHFLDRLINKPCRQQGPVYLACLSHSQTTQPTRAMETPEQFSGRSCSVCQ